MRILARTRSVLQNLVLKRSFIWLKLHTVVSFFMLGSIGARGSSRLRWSIHWLVVWNVVLICRSIRSWHFRRYLLCQLSFLRFKRDITARRVLSSSILDRGVLSENLFVSEVRIERWNISDLMALNIALSKQFLLQSSFRHLSRLRRMKHTHLDSIMLCLLACGCSLRLWWRVTSWLRSVLWFERGIFRRGTPRVLFLTAIFAA